MPVAEKSQALRALDRANEVRLAAVEERRELRGRSFTEISAAVIDPTPAFASFRLDFLFSSSTESALIRQFGPKLLNHALADCGSAAGPGRRSWHPRLRLRDLTRRERKLLMSAIAKRAPWAVGDSA